MASLTHKSDYEARLKEVSLWIIPDIEKKKIPEFIQEYKHGRVTGRIGKNIEATLERVLESLRTPLEFFNKSISQLTEKDVKIFFDSLMGDVIKQIKEKDKPYAVSTKKKMLWAISRYMEFRLKKQQVKLMKFLSILKVKIAVVEKEPEYLDETEFEKLHTASRENWERYLHNVLAWGGMRASEFHGITAQDIFLPEGDESFVKIRIKNQNSKTKGRTVALYGKHCLKAVKEYLEERKKEGLQPDEYIFNHSYDRVKKYLARLGQKVLKRHLHYHLYRSTCATWLADKGLSRDQKCIFFGWKFSSPMPDIYQSRKGISMKEFDKKILNTELEVLKKEIEKQKQANDNQRIRLEMKESDIQNIRKEVTKQQKRLIELENNELKRKQADEIINNLTKDPRSLKLIARALARLGLVERLVNI